VLIVHGTVDSIISFKDGEKLANKVKKEYLYEFYGIEGANHNDIFRDFTLALHLKLKEYFHFINEARKLNLLTGSLDYTVRNKSKKTVKPDQSSNENNNNYINNYNNISHNENVSSNDLSNKSFIHDQSQSLININNINFNFNINSESVNDIENFVVTNNKDKVNEKIKAANLLSKIGLKDIIFKNSNISLNDINEKFDSESSNNSEDLSKKRTGEIGRKDIVKKKNINNDNIIEIQDIKQKNMQKRIFSETQKTLTNFSAMSNIELIKLKTNSIEYNSEKNHNNLEIGINFINL